MPHLTTHLTSHLRRLLAACAAVAVVVPPAFAQAQENPPTETAAPDQATPDDVITMSNFVVRTTKGKGYSFGNAASAMKNNEPLMNTPQNIITITNDLVTDIGAVATTDILQYAGVATSYRGEAPAIRGGRVSYPYTDDMPDSLPYTDNANIDTFEVIKGPVQIFYPGAALGGLVLKTSKKPLPYQSGNIATTFDEWGGRRLTLDVTGPLAKLGKGQLNYRLVGAAQGGDTYNPNMRNNHLAIFPSVEWDWKNTSVILEYAAQIIHQPDTFGSWLAPTGELYTGGGEYRTAVPPNNAVKFASRNIRGRWIQKISEGWEMKLSGQMNNYNRYGPELFPGFIDYDSGIVYYLPFFNDEWNSRITAQLDVSGKYEIANLRNTSSVGFYFEDQLDIAKMVVGDILPEYIIPIGSEKAINGLVVPPASTWPPNPATGPRTKNYVSSVYFMQQVDLIPDRLSLVAGLTFSSTEIIQAADLSAASPYTATELNGHELLHRLGIVYHITKDFMVYGTEATNYTPSAGVDYYNRPLPSVLGKNDEVGIKTAFWDGRLSSTFSYFDMSLTNQAIVAPLTDVNVAGVNYKLPIGTTTTKGWDASVALTLTPGWQVMATGYIAKVRDRNNQPVDNTYGNSMSLFTRYDFAKNSPLKGLAIGGGLSRVGDYTVTTAGLVFPAGMNQPDLFKMKQGTLVKLFASYKWNKHWEFRASIDNLLDEAFGQGQQGPSVIDPSDPRTVSIGITYNIW